LCREVKLSLRSAWGADETISVKLRYENLGALTQASLATIDRSTGRNIEVKKSRK
jgi:hypothetical protein